MGKITKKVFNEFLQNILADSVIPSIAQTNINEFKIGKSYFYELKDNDNLLAIQKALDKKFQKEI
ncbi:MAG: hypothetical protein LGB53_02790, partial [Sulfurovum sp.]|nr:hypothetical protein [Sulfurovum sp.]